VEPLKGYRNKKGQWFVWTVRPTNLEYPMEWTYISEHLLLAWMPFLEPRDATGPRLWVIKKEDGTPIPMIYSSPGGYTDVMFKRKDGFWQTNTGVKR